MERTTYTSDTSRPDDLARALVAGGFETERVRPLNLTVLDTFDGRLNAAGQRLEQHEGDRRELTLIDDGPVVATVAVERRPVFAADLPNGPLTARLAPLLDVRALQPMLVLTGSHGRAVRRDDAGKARAAVVVYEDLSVDGRPLAGFGSVAAVEALEGYSDEARQARRLLDGVGFDKHPGDVVDLAAAVAGVDLRGFVSSPTVALDRDEIALTAYRRVLANLAGAMQANWAGTVEHRDPEFLHDLRVAVRRSRSVLARSKGVLPDDVRDRYREEFAWLGTVTGPARDLDVYEIEWADYVEPLGAEAVHALQPLAAHIASLRDEAHAEVSAALRSDRYHLMMLAWMEWVAGPTDAGNGAGRHAGRPIGRLAARRIARAQERLLARGRDILPTTPAEELHELRKDAKRLRYLLECFGALLTPSPRKAFVQRLKSLQDNLGEHQDTEVHAAQLRTFSHQLFGDPAMSPEGLLAMGRLAERFEVRRQAAREEFAERFAGYDTPETALAMRAMLRPATTS